MLPLKKAGQTIKKKRNREGTESDSRGIVGQGTQ